MLFWLLRQTNTIAPFRSSDGGDGGGGGGGGADIEATVEKLLRGKEADGVVRDLLKDNFRQREQLREKDAEITGLKGKIPGEGAVVLTKEEAAAWSAYTELGKPEDLKTAMERRDALEQDAKERKEAEDWAKAGKALGLKNPKLLRDLPGAKELDLEFRTEGSGEEETEKVFVKPRTDGATPVELASHIDEHWAAFKPSLMAGSDGDGAGGQPFPRQSGGGGRPGPEDAVKTAVGETYVTPSERAKAS